MTQKPSRNADEEGRQGGGGIYCPPIVRLPLPRALVAEHVVITWRSHLKGLVPPGRKALVYAAA